ncbi:MAG: small, acid-soluble spore protein, alpha/beta type [Thermaerobacter sp.]|nr:small, acid-soluble spore protein, alpha/beta type [Thermaerobacter sp.]
MTTAKEPSPEELAREALKWEAAAALDLVDKVRREGWGGLSARESGRVGGLMTKWTRDRVPSARRLNLLEKPGG